MKELMPIAIVVFGTLLITGFIWARNFKWYRKLACKMGWHSYPNFDNCHKHKDDPNQFLNFAQCQWCKYEGQIDSQGNLF